MVVACPYRAIDQGGPVHIAIEFERPIVASNIGGTPEILSDGVHGYLVPPEDPGAFARALERVLTDRERTREMSHAVGRLADSLSWEVISRKTIAVYEGF